MVNEGFEILGDAATLMPELFPRVREAAKEFVDGMFNEKVSRELYRECWELEKRWRLDNPDGSRRYWMVRALICFSPRRYEGDLIDVVDFLFESFRRSGLEDDAGDHLLIKYFGRNASGTTTTS